MPPQNREAVAGKPGRSPPWRQAPCLASSRFLVFIFPVCGAPGRVALPLVRPLTCPYLHRFPVFPIPHAYPTPEFAHDRYPEELLMTAITDALVAEARHACPIEDVVAAAGVTLWRTAGGPLKGLCPFHDEQAPSLTVRPERGLWYCFMYCDGGDVV